MYLLLRRVRCSVTEVFKFCWTMFVQVKGMCVGACGLQVAGRVLVIAGWGLCVGNCSLGIAGWGLTIPVNGRLLGTYHHFFFVTTNYFVYNM